MKMASFAPPILVGSGVQYSTRPPGSGSTHLGIDLPAPAVTITRVLVENDKQNVHQVGKKIYCTGKQKYQNGECWHQIGMDVFLGFH